MSPEIFLAPILMAEDDKDDCFLTEKAFQENKISNPLVIVSNGEDLVDYLYRRGKFSGLSDESSPCFVLLDLNMPRMDGREALKVIKNDRYLKKIPVVVMTTSRAAEDISKSYDFGANSYVVKPPTFDGLVRMVQALKNYWLEVVQLPPERDSHSRD
jgi:CheY-like chemotaxis protein